MARMIQTMLLLVRMAALNRIHEFKGKFNPKQEIQSLSAQPVVPIESTGEASQFLELLQQNAVVASS